MDVHVADSSKSTASERADSPNMSNENPSTLAKIYDTTQKLTVPMADSTETIQGWTGPLEAPLSPTYSNSDFNEYDTPQSLNRDTSWYIFPWSYSAPSVSNDGYHNITAVDLHVNSSGEISRQHSDTLQSSLTFVQGNYSACQDQNQPLPMCPLTSFTDFPTPPPTPDSHIELSIHPPFTPCHDNPLEKNAIAYSLFQQYLDDKWQKDSLKIGGGVIRAALYAKITNTLLGGVAPARLRQWVKRSQFFLTTGSHSSHTDFRARLAVPGHRLKAGGISSTTTPGGKAKYAGNNHYRLVAQLEDFVHIIGCYHNDQVGHHGIRKTHALVS